MNLELEYVMSKYARRPAVATTLLSGVMLLAVVALPAVLAARGVVEARKRHLNDVALLGAVAATLFAASVPPLTVQCPPSVSNPLPAMAFVQLVGATVLSIVVARKAKRAGCSQCYDLFLSASLIFPGLLILFLILVGTGAIVLGERQRRGSI